MDTGSHREDNQTQQFASAVSDRVLVDVFKPKFGSEKDIVVFTFLVNQRHAAQRLSRFISQGPFDLVDVEASLAPDEEGHFLVFLEMQRNRNMFATMDDILEHVGFMANIDKWRFRPYGHKTFSEWSRDSFVKTVPQSPGEYADHGEKSNNDRPTAVAEDKSKELVESNKLSLQQLIENQINRHSKAYIKSLQDQIHAVIQDNQQLLERVEELKKEQQYLHQQIQFYQKHENISLEREEQIYERIRDMESKIEMLGSPGGRDSESLVSDLMTPPTHLGEKVVAEAGSADVLQGDQIAMTHAGMDIFDVDHIDRSAEELDPVETTMFELETSLGVSPAESFLPEDELLDDDRLDAVEDISPVADPNEDRSVVALEVLDIEDNGAHADPPTEWVPEPDVTSWQETDALADDAANGSPSMWEDDDERFTAALEEDDRDFESVADLPIADGKSAGPETDTLAKPGSSGGDSVVQAATEAITELDTPLEDADTVTEAVSAEAEESVVQASSEEITELDTPLEDADTVTEAVSAETEESVVQASSEAITELDTPLADADTVTEAVSAETEESVVQASSEEITELDTPLEDADTVTEAVSAETEESVVQASSEAITELDTPLEDADTVTEAVSAETEESVVQASSEEITELDTPLEDTDTVTEAVSAEAEESVVQASSEEITEPDTPLEDTDTVSEAVSAETEESVVQASSEEITELDTPLEDTDTVTEAVSAETEESVVQASSEAITELDTPLADADTVSEAVSAETEESVVQASSEEITELDTPLADADEASEDMPVESDLPAAAMEAPSSEAMAPLGPSDAYAAEAVAELTTSEDKNVETATGSLAAATADEPFETGMGEWDEGDVGTVATMMASQKPPDDSEARPQLPKTEESADQADLVDDSKTPLETAPDQKDARRTPQPSVSSDLSHLEDTIHELESIVVTETDSEKVSTAADDGRTDRDAVKEQVSQYLKLGNEAYQQSRYLKAIDYFNKAVALTPDVPVGHLNLAVLAYRLGDYGEAAKHASRAMKLGSQSASRILDKAESKMKTDKPDVRPDSEKSPQPLSTAAGVRDTVSDDDDGSEVIELGPENELPDQNGEPVVKTATAAIDARGADSPEGGDRRPSTERKTEATARNAPEPGTRTGDTAERDIANEYFSLGLAASEKKKYSEAFEHFMKAVDLTPEIPAGYLNLAVISYKLKDYRQALKFAEQALANGSRSAQTILDKATDKLKATEQIRAVKPEGRDKAPGAPTTEVVGKTEAAVEPSDSAPQSSPQSPQADTVRDITAKASVEAAGSPVEVKPSAPEDVAPAKTGDSAAVDPEKQEDDSSTGAAGIEEEKNPANEYFTLGLAASEKKNYAEAVEHFKKVVALSPDSPAGHLNLAVLAYRQKDYRSAHLHARQALTLGSQSARKILEKATHKLSAQTPVAETAREKKIDARPPGKASADRQKGGSAVQSFSSAAAAPDGLLVENEEIIFDTDPMDRFRKAEKPAAEQADDGQRTPKALPRKQATSSDSELANEYFRLGVEASEQKAFEKAIRYFTKVTEILPTARRSYIKLAVLYYQIKDFKTAKELAQKAIELGSTSAEKILKKSEVKLKRRVAAKTDSAPPVPKSQTDRPEAPEPEAPSPTVQNESGQPDATPAPTSQKPPVEAPAASVSPGKSGSDKSSTEETGKPVEPSVTKNYSVNEYFAMGLAASERKEYQQAIEYFTKVTELLPDASPSFLNLANLYLNLEDYATAREHAQRALDLGSKSAQRILDDVDALTK